MRITFTLTSGSLSTDAGPFNISGTTNSNVTYWIATGVTKTELTNGYPVDTIYETITGGTIASTGTCTTTDTWSVTPAPTPTATPIPPTPTDVPSPTPTPFGAGGRYNCDGFNGGCVEAVDGDYDSLAACEAACPQSPGPA
jgi:hypothetical protein